MTQFIFKGEMIYKFWAGFKTLEEERAFTMTASVVKNRQK